MISRIKLRGDALIYFLDVARMFEVLKLIQWRKSPNNSDKLSLMVSLDLIRFHSSNDGF